MYGSYGSYSSMSAASAPMDITSRNLFAHDATCAFPSWPRRSSLSESDREERPTSYLSDDDLFLSEHDDDARSVSSAGSAGSPAAMSPAHAMTEQEIFEMQRERLALQEQYLRTIVSEKERRRAAQKKQQRRSSSGSSKKSPKSKLSSMTPIAE